MKRRLKARLQPLCTLRPLAHHSLDPLPQFFQYHLKGWGHRQLYTSLMGRMPGVWMQRPSKDNLEGQ